MNSLEKGFMLQRSVPWHPDTHDQLRTGCCGPLGHGAGREIREGPFRGPSVLAESMDPELREGQAASPCRELNSGTEGEDGRSILCPPTSVLSNSSLVSSHRRLSPSQQLLTMPLIGVQGDFRASVPRRGSELG